MSEKAKEINCKINKIYGFLNNKETKVIAEVSWNGGEARIDLRKCWKNGSELKLGGGISLNDDEVDVLSSTLPSVTKTKKKTVDFDAVFSRSDDIIAKRDAGYSTQDGFIKLIHKPGCRLDKKKSVKMITTLCDMK